MSKEAIILAGGKGTRLRSVVVDLPKPMASVAGVPFLEHQLNYLHNQGIETVILSVGYKAEIICNYFGETYKGMSVRYAYENTPLGTGGAIANAIELVTEKDVYVLNGDTYFPISLTKLYSLHQYSNATISIALRSITNDGRFGGVQVDKTGRISGFTTKGDIETQLINGGIYRINVVNYQKIVSNIKSFSFEEDILKSFHRTELFYGIIYYDYFIDIGIPADYARANIELKDKPTAGNGILFLDRDGVINKKIDNDYVRTWTDFIFLPDSLLAIKILSSKFNKLVVITNQRGVARGLMTVETLAEVHTKMSTVIKTYGGRIDGIYVCPHHTTDNCGCRKPESGLIEQAKADFPSADTLGSVLVGDAVSDMQLGRQMAYRTVLIQYENSFDYIALNLADEVYPSLYRWAKSIDKQIFFLQ